MTNPMRKREISRTLLTTLLHAQGYAVPEASLRPQVDGLLSPPADDDEWAEVTESMEDRGRIVRVADDFDAELVKWAITERGRVALQTL